MWVKRKDWEDLRKKVADLEEEIKKQQRLWDLLIARQKDLTKSNCQKNQK